MKIDDVGALHVLIVIFLFFMLPLLSLTNAELADYLLHYHCF